MRNGLLMLALLGLLSSTGCGSLMRRTVDVTQSLPCPPVELRTMQPAPDWNSFLPQRTRREPPATEIALSWDHCSPGSTE